MVVSLIVLSLFAAQLLRIQGFDSDAVAADALRQRTQTEAIPAHRGTIYDVNNTVLAQSQERRTVIVDQTAVPEYKKTVDGERTTVGVEGAAEDLAEMRWVVEEEGARIIFPNPKVKNGLRAGILIVPDSGQRLG